MQNLILAFNQPTEITEVPISSQLALIEHGIYEIYHVLNELDNESTLDVLRTLISTTISSLIVFIDRGYSVDIIASERFARPVMGIYLMFFKIVRLDVDVDEFLLNDVVVKEIEWSKCNEKYLQYVEDLDNVE